jgi:hypothetical protein
VTAGLSASYGNFNGITAALNASLNDGSLDPALFEARIKRNLLTTFRLGVYDTVRGRGNGGRLASASMCGCPVDLARRTL